MPFDLLDKPLVYITVGWKGVGADEDGAAKIVDHEVQIQVEMLDADELTEWIVSGSADPLANERLEWSERANAANADLDAGVEGAAARVVALNAELDDMRKRGKALTDARDLASFKRVAHGWRGIKSNGRVPKFDDENIARLLKFGGFPTAFGEAYRDATIGKLKVREGNFGGSPANGPAGGPTDETPKAATSATSTNEN